jgi:Zn finger protein HypA/HybF involved in hydrogenase expression
MNELECPVCKHKFSVEDYDFGDCPKCGKAEYYWDYVLDEETCEEYFAGFYWEIKK